MVVPDIGSAPGATAAAVLATCAAAGERDATVVTLTTLSAHSQAVPPWQQQQHTAQRE